MSPALGVHELAHDISEATVTQLTEEAWRCSRIIHPFLDVLQSYITDKRSQRTDSVNV